MHRKKPCGRGAALRGQPDWKKLSGGRTEISPLKLDTRAAARCLLARALLENFGFVPLSCAKSAPSR